MRKLGYYLSILTLFFALSANAQEDLTFYHMGNATPQAAMYNPTFFPDTKLFISLPGISGVNLEFTNSFSYNDLYTPIEGTDSVKRDWPKLASKLQPGDRFNVSGNVSLFQFGLRIGDNSAFTVFANERFSAYYYYPTALIGLMAEGNIGGETISEEYVKAGGVHFREYGLGYSHELGFIPGIKAARIGVRAKYIQGFIEFGTDEGTQMFVKTNEDLTMEISTNKAEMRATGLEIENTDYFIQNTNTGFGFDFGLDVDITDKWSAAFAVNDIGKITWQEGVANYSLKDDDPLVLNGLEDIQDIDGSIDALMDSIESFGEFDTTYLDYQRSLNSRYVLSTSYKVFEKGTVTATFLTKRDITNEFVNSFGLGYTHYFGRILGLSATVSKSDNQKVGLGAGMDLKFGGLQFYTAFNNLLGVVDVRDMESFGFRAGINILIGRLDKPDKESKSKNTKQEKPKPISIPKPKKESLSPFPPQYELDHLK
ncbi:MAG: DUF5723 family protein [Reichenbachiella sp.]